MRILGEVVLEADGVLHGWCWSPDKPHERRTVDIVIDEEIAVTLIASRFREDLRFRKFGDGYHGFTVTLAKQIANASNRSVISARDRASGISFWQKRFGEFSIPEEFGARVTALRSNIASLTQASGLNQAKSSAKAGRFAAALGGLGERLQPSEKPEAITRPILLPCPATPALSIILDAGADGAACLRNLRLGASAFHQANAEVILIDAGADPALPRLQAQVKHLKYLRSPGLSNAARRNAAAAAARASTLVFLNQAPPGPAASLAGLQSDARETIIVSTALASAASRVAPTVFGNPPQNNSHAWPGMQLALPAQYLRPLDETIDDGTGLDLIDLILRAARAGTPIAIAQSPHGPTPPAPTPTNIEAGHRFAERWVMGWRLE